MKIEKATHKAYLYGLFYDRTPNGLMPKSLPINQLNDASSAAKKLLNKAEDNDGLVQFIDGEVTFAVDEWVLLRELLDGVTKANITEAETIQELKEIFTSKDI